MLYYNPLLNNLILEIIIFKKSLFMLIKPEPLKKEEVKLVSL